MHLARDERKEDMNPLTGKVQRSGTFDGYEVAGWRHSDHPSWNVKVWLAGCPRDWFGYTVTAGMFELKICLLMLKGKRFCTRLAHGTTNWWILKFEMNHGMMGLSDLAVPVGVRAGPPGTREVRPAA